MSYQGTVRWKTALFRRFKYLDLFFSDTEHVKLDCIVGFLLKLCSILSSCHNSVNMEWIAAVVRKSFAVLYPFPDRIDAVVNHPYRVRYHLCALRRDVACSKRYQAEHPEGKERYILQRDSSVFRICASLGSMIAGAAGSSIDRVEAAVPWTEVTDASLAEAVQAHSQYCTIGDE